MFVDITNSNLFRNTNTLLTKGDAKITEQLSWIGDQNRG